MSPGKIAGGELDFWTFQFRANLVRYSYGVIIAFFLIAALIAAIPYWRSVCARWVHYLILAVLLGAGGSWVYFLSKRPAGTTFFEAATSWLALGCMALSLIRLSRRGSLLVFWFFLGGIAYSACSFALGGNIGALRSSAVQGKMMWRLHHDLLEFAAGREVIVILPDNSYCYGGVAEALVKGAGDFPGWTVTRHGRPSLDLYAPTLNFRSEFGNTSPNETYPANLPSLFWVDRPELEPIASKYARLDEIARRQDLRRKDWSIPIVNGLLSAHAIQTPETATP